MNDKVFESSLIALSTIVFLWIILGSIFIINPAWAIVTGLIAWLIGGGVLLHYWGKNYMGRI
jgi:hypothetical protein